MRFSAKLSPLLMAAGLLMASSAISAAQVFPSSVGNIMIETFAKGLDHPWALAFLPDGRILVTERGGRMHLVGKDGRISPAFAAVPKVSASGQGVLHDVVLDRLYAENHTIYFCYAEPVGGGGRTALRRGAPSSRSRARASAVRP